MIFFVPAARKHFLFYIISLTTFDNTTDYLGIKIKDYENF